MKKLELIELIQQEVQAAFAGGFTQSDLGFSAKLKFSNNEIDLLKKFIKLNGVKQTIRTIKQDKEGFLSALKKFAGKL